MKSIFKLKTLSVAIVGMLAFSSCQKEELAISEPDGANVTLSGNFNTKEIKEVGVYTVSGTARGNITLNLPSNATGTLEIKGADANAMLVGIAKSGIRADGHFTGNVPAGVTLKIHDLKMKHLAHHIIDFWGPGKKLITNVIFYAQTYKIGTTEYYGVAPGNCDGNATYSGCTMYSGDDACQLTGGDTYYKNCTINMNGNGAVCQMGWGTRCKGANHVAENLTVSGYIKNNGQTDTINEAGRTIVGGGFQNSGISNINITGLNCTMTSAFNAHIVRLRADGQTVTGINIQGTINVVPANATNFHAIALSTTNKGKLQNVAIDFAGKVKASNVYKDAGVTGYTLK